MAKRIKNVDTIGEILDVMHKGVVGALINSQLTKDNSVANAVDLIAPDLAKFDLEDVKTAFIVFALNVAADSLATANSQDTGKVEAQTVVMTKPAQA